MASVCIPLPIEIFALIKLVALLFFFFVITMIVVVIGFRDQVSSNWEQYQCHPMYMPFADFFGHSSDETAEKCSYETYKKSHAESISPFLDVVSSASTTMSSAGDMMTQMDGVLDGVQNMFSSSFSSILSQIGNTTAVIQYMIIKLEVILQRISATFLVVMYTLSASLQGILAIKNDETLLHAIDTIIKFPGF